MPTYPAFRQIAEESARDRLSGLAADEGGNLSLWIRNMGPVEKFSFSIVHILDATQLATLEAFYTANKVTAIVPFDFVMNDKKSVTYTNCVFVDAPQFVKRIARGVDKYRVRFRQL